jgi:hypothetical protein
MLLSHRHPSSVLALAGLRRGPFQRVIGRRSSRAIWRSKMRFMRALLSRYARGFLAGRQSQPWLVVSCAQATAAARCCGAFVTALLFDHDRASGAA